MILLTCKENVILFDQKYYSPIDRVAVASTWGPTLANIFLCHHETTWSKSLQTSVLIKICYDILVFFEKPEQVLWFVNYMNKRHKNTKFLSETENDNSFSFLSVKLCREKDTFTLSVFRKDMVSGVYTNFSSFETLEDKSGLKYALLHWSVTIKSDFSKFCFEVETFKKTVHKNVFPAKFLTNV